MKCAFTLFFVITLSVIPIRSLDGEIYFTNRYKLIKAYELEIYKDKHREMMLKSIIQVESSGKVDAYNKSEDAVGVLQIRPIMLRHANMIVGYERYTLDDRWCMDTSIEIFWIVQEYHNPNMWLDQACHLWNAGIPNKNKWGITEGYREKVSIEYNRLMAGNFK